MARETDIRVIKTKRAIREAVIELMRDHDPREITVREVADAAYINRRTFFAHYGSVSQVVDEVVEEGAAEVVRILDEGDSTSLRGVYSIIRKIYAQSKDASSPFGRVFTTSARLEVSNEVRSVLSKRLLSRYSGAGEAGSSAAPGESGASAADGTPGASGALSQERTAYLSDYIAGGIVSLTLRWLTHDKDMSAEETEEVSSLTYDLLVEGIKRLSASRKVALQG
jgi:AcrR family transcriptional regulator